MLDSSEPFVCVLFFVFFNGIYWNWTQVICQQEMTWEDLGDVGDDLPQCSCRLLPICCPEEDSSYTWNFQQWRQLHKMEDVLVSSTVTITRNHKYKVAPVSHRLSGMGIVFCSRDNQIFKHFVNTESFGETKAGPFSQPHWHLPVTPPANNTNMDCFHGERSAVQESHKVQQSAGPPLHRLTQLTVRVYEEWTLINRNAGTSEAGFTSSLSVVTLCRLWLWTGFNF